MPDYAEWLKTTARTKALLLLARETRAAARNLRHTAVLRRALNKLMHSGLHKAILWDGTDINPADLS
jgi:hypothetical protein